MAEPSPSRRGATGARTTAAPLSEPEVADSLFGEAEGEAYADAVVAEPGGAAGAGAVVAGRQRRVNVAFWLAVAWLGALVVLAALADVLPFVEDPLAVDASAARQGLSTSHWLGGDANGRDIFSRCVYGARFSLVVGVAAVLIGGVVGGLLGLVAGYFRGRWERLIMAVIDVMLAFPALVLALAIVSFMGQNLRNVTLALGILAIPALTRITRAATLVFAQREFVQAARTLGARDRRILFREVLPNVVPGLVSYAFVVVAVLIVAEGVLSFLGLGIPAPDPSWGNMIAEGRIDVDVSPHIAFVPAAVLFLTVLSLNFVGDKLRSRFDVRESSL